MLNPNEIMRKIEVFIDEIVDQVVRVVEFEDPDKKHKLSRELKNRVKQAIVGSLMSIQEGGDNNTNAPSDH